MRGIIWAIFGNDEDGPYGIYPHTLLGAVRWWLRNPMHNLFFHVINWPGGPYWHFGKLGGPGWNGYIGWRPWNGAFGIKIVKQTSKEGM